MKNLKNKCRRGLALILSLVLCLGMLTVPAFAEENGDSEISGESGEKIEMQDSVEEGDPDEKGGLDQKEEPGKEVGSGGEETPAEEADLDAEETSAEEEDPDEDILLADETETEEEPAPLPSGECGEAAFWALSVNNADAENPTYTLTISGKGAMANYGDPQNKAPWRTALTDSVSITKVVIGADITAIGSFAFVLCKGIESVKFEEGCQVEKIGESAFNQVVSLKEITLPGTLSVIDGAAFYGCKNLETVAFENAAALVEIKTSAFAACTKLSQLNSTEAGCVALPENVTKIGPKAFQACASITSVSIPAGVETLQSTFYDCKSLETVTFAPGSALKKLISGGSQASVFTGTALKDISLPATLEEIGNHVFFSKNIQLESLEIPAQVKFIGADAFRDAKINQFSFAVNSQLEELYGLPTCSESSSTVILPEGLKKIGAGALNRGFKYISIPSSVTTIEKCAIGGCTAGIDLSAVADDITISRCVTNAAHGYVIYLASESKIGEGDPKSLEGTKVNYWTGGAAYAITNGGTFPKGTVFTNEVVNTSKVSCILATPVRDGYKFAGWYANSQFSGTPVTKTQPNATYYAKWIPEGQIEDSTTNFEVPSVLQFGKVTYGDEIGSQSFTVTPKGGESAAADAQIDVKTGNSKVFEATCEGNTVTVTPKAGLPAGSYTVVIYVTTPDGVCHFVPTILTVEQAVYDMNKVTFQNKTVEYDGQEKSLTIGGDLPKIMIGGQEMTGVKVRYFPTNTYTDAGEHEVMALFTGLDRLNYKPITPITAKLTITKAAHPGEVNFAGESNTLLYDGSPKTVEVTGTLQPGVTVSYQYARVTEEGETKVVEEAVDAGTYTVTAKFTSTGNYNAPISKTTMLTIEKAQPQLTITPSNVSLTGGGEVVLTVSGAPEGGEVRVTCDKDIVVADNKATLPNSDAEYTFTAAYAGDANHEAARDTCTVSVTRVEPPHEHQWGEWRVVVPATCGRAGAQIRTCTTDEKHAEVKTIPSTGEHTWDNGVVTLRPTATREGERTYTCTVCGATRTEAIDRLDREPSYPSGGSSGGTTTRPSTPTATVPDTPTPLDPGAAIGDQDVPLTGISFEDVTPGDWFYEAVQYVYGKELMKGTSGTQFSPYASTQRGMIVTILHRLEGTPAAEASAFADVEAGQWYADAVGWGSANGVVEGYSTSEFRPLRNITREQMAAILYRYAQLKGYDTSKRADLSGYTDAGKISAYALEAMQWAVAEELITGKTETTLVPGGEATRAEAAMILMRFCENVAAAPAANETQGLPDGI